MKLCSNLKLSTFALFIFLPMFLVACSDNDNGPHQFKFLMTANVEVDGKIKSGSSVIEVLYNKPAIGGFGANHIAGARGTMPIVDLGQGKAVALSFRTSIWSDRNDFTAEDQQSFPFKAGLNCRIDDVKYLPTRIMLQGAHRRTVPEIAKELNAIPLGKKVKFTNRSMIMNVINSGDANSRNETYNFCNLSDVLGDRYAPISITIERTEKPLKFLIDAAPDWLLRWRFRCKALKEWKDDEKKTVTSWHKNKERFKKECPFFPHIETEKYVT